MRSVWQDGAARRAYPTLNESQRTDVLVIGGGMAGLLCAYYLTEAGVDCTLVESGRICDGTTGNTTAKLTLQHGLIYDGMIKRFGAERAGKYLEAQRRAIAEYLRLGEAIDCDLERCDSYVYSTKNREKLEREVIALDRLGVRAELCDTPTLPVSTVGAVRVADQACFHPLKLALRLAEGLKIYEGTRVTELAPGIAVTDGGVISCEKMIVATHFPILNKHGAYFLKMYQHRSYVTALEGAGRVGGMFVDEDHRGMSFRDYGDTLLLGGGGHRTGKQGGAWRELEQLVGEHYPNAKITHKWAAQDCMTLDQLPYIGKYSKRTSNLFVATGFNKWGMTSSMVAARLLCDLILGRHNDCEEVFSPSRSILRPQLALNSVETVLNLLTPTVPRCPHLGCALKYNEWEHSWDCPCHGSRFDEEGGLLDGPATADKRGMSSRSDGDGGGGQ